MNKKQINKSLDEAKEIIKDYKMTPKEKAIIKAVQEDYVQNMEKMYPKDVIRIIKNMNKNK